MAIMYLLAISAARRSIYITNPYFVPDDELLEALTRAAERKVRVVLLIPAAIDHGLVKQAGWPDLGRLLEAGVEIFEYRPALLHAKTMVIDGVWATVGSTNLDRRSFALNDELNLVVYDAAVARRLQRIFERDLAHSTRLTYGEWRGRGLWSRILEAFASPFRSQL
jgi:cardiolipin synthase